MNRAMELWVRCQEDVNWVVKKGEETLVMGTMVSDYCEMVGIMNPSVIKLSSYQACVHHHGGEGTEEEEEAWAYRSQGHCVNPIVASIEMSAHPGRGCEEDCSQESKDSGDAAQSQLEWPSATVLLVETSSRIPADEAHCGITTADEACLESEEIGAGGAMTTVTVR